MMTAAHKGLASAAGKSPGTLHYIGEEKFTDVKITVIDYSPDHLEEHELENVEECFPFRYKDSISWINVDGVHKIDVIEKIGHQFKLHPLLLEDVVNTEQRPKIDYFEDQIFVSCKMLNYEEKDGKIITEQVSLILGENYVISFQEDIEGDAFDPVRERLRNTLKGKTRNSGPDYLFYALLDTIIDGYFGVIEKLGSKIENLEEKLINKPQEEDNLTIYKIKRDLMYVRKAIWPLREVMGSLYRTDMELIKPNTHLFIKDIYDHTIHVIDTLDIYRDMISGLMDIYFNSVSNRMNAIIKVLTIISTIFIPLTFLVGVYGMNFKYMPELEWEFGYMVTWLIMLILVGYMIYAFKKKNWL